MCRVTCIRGPRHPHRFSVSTLPYAFDIPRCSARNFSLLPPALRVASVLFMCPAVGKYTYHPHTISLWGLSAASSAHGQYADAEQIAPVPRGAPVRKPRIISACRLSGCLALSFFTPPRYSAPYWCNRAIEPSCFYIPRSVERLPSFRLSYSRPCAGKGTAYFCIPGGRREAWISIRSRCGYTAGGAVKN